MQKDIILKEQRLTKKWKNFKNKAKRRDKKIGITKDDYVNLFEQKRCAYSGLFMTDRPNERFSKSLDRVDADKGYIPGNVVVCCSWLNSVKADYENPSCSRYTKNKQKRHKESVRRFIRMVRG